MLHILLFILKIIGCLLLTILGIVLLALVIVLFVPFTYGVQGEKNGSASASASVKWLFGLIEGRISFDLALPVEKRLRYYLRIAWIRLIDNQKAVKEKSEKKPEREKAVDNGPEPEIKTPETDFDEEPDVFDDTPVDFSETEESTHEADQNPEDAGSAKGDASRQEEIKKKPQVKVKVSDRIALILRRLIKKAEKLLNIPGKITGKLEKLSAKLERLSKKKEHLFKIIRNEKNYAWFMSTLTDLKRLLLGIFPKIEKLKLHYGTGDPELTGKILGWLSMLYGISCSSMEITPEFDRALIEGELSLKGRIRLFPFVVFAVKHFLNRRFFHIFKQIRRI